jgi:hypothetical protein
MKVVVVLGGHVLHPGDEGAGALAAARSIAALAREHDVAVVVAPPGAHELGRLERDIAGELPHRRIVVERCSDEGEVVDLGPVLAHGVVALVVCRDQDAADDNAARLAQSLDADALLFLTDQRGVHSAPGAGGYLLRVTRPQELRGVHLTNSLAHEAAAACRFVEATDRTAVIGAVRDAVAMLRGDAGTLVRSY